MMSEAFTMEMADPDLTSTGSSEAASCNKIKLGNNNQIMDQKDLSMIGVMWNGPLKHLQTGKTKSARTSAQSDQSPPFWYIQ